MRKHSTTLMHEPIIELFAAESRGRALQELEIVKGLCGRPQQRAFGTGTYTGVLARLRSCMVISVQGSPGLSAAHTSNLKLSCIDPSPAMSMSRTEHSHLWWTTVLLEIPRQDTIRKSPHNSATSTESCSEVKIFAMLDWLERGRSSLKHVIIVIMAQSADIRHEEHLAVFQGSMYRCMAYLRLTWPQRQVPGCQHSAAQQLSLISDHTRYSPHSMRSSKAFPFLRCFDKAFDASADSRTASSPGTQPGTTTLPMHRSSINPAPASTPYVQGKYFLARRAKLCR